MSPLIKSPAFPGACSFSTVSISRPSAATETVSFKVPVAVKLFAFGVASFKLLLLR